MASVIAVIAPYVNSYRRYVRDFAAPINLEWGRDNRTTGLRVPISAPEARRIENRLPGMDCNPYLCIAASLACGYLGMKNEIWPDKRFQGDAYDAPDEIPHGLNVALDLFDKAEDIHKVLGPDFARVYSIVKRAEYKEFLQVISPWEREHLLLNV
jgi:glutamine synthetase